MGRLVVVSNRVPSPREGRREAAGGLAVALRQALEQSGGVWFGWSGDTAETSSSEPQVSHRRSVTYAVVDLGRKDVAAYYAGFSNATLWPLLHYRLGLVEFRSEDLLGYQRVNRHFANCLQKLLRPDDLIWVHDYHLIPLGAELRRLGVRNRIGFFLHTPFPPHEIVAAVPRSKWLLESFAAYDVIGLQTGNDAAMLRRSMDEGLRDVVLARPPRIDAFPISIDERLYARVARSAVRGAETQRTVASLVGRQLIFGVDRLDYSKGLPQRFQAYDGLLANHPEHRSQVSYLQLAPISRGDVAEYRQLRRELERLAGSINGKYADLDWTPLRYLNRTVGRATLAGLYRSARVGLVTPLRDGMNLVAKEYVAAQDPEDPGVLVLSRFAGAANELSDALLVNPLDIEEVTMAIDLALRMPLDERQRRWRASADALARNSVQHWVESFLAALGPENRSGGLPSADHRPPPSTAVRR